MPGMSEHLNSDIAFSAIVALGISVPVSIGILESRPPVWDGEIVFDERKVEKPKPRILRRRLPLISWEELDANRL
jgi:hypothetical protein